MPSKGPRLSYADVLIRRRVLATWITTVLNSGEYRSIHHWACAAAMPSQTIYRFLNGETNNICARNLRKLARVTTVPLTQSNPVPPRNPTYSRTACPSAAR
jgi:hypothetical protein